jgi:hypothetical protein
MEKSKAEKELKMKAAIDNLEPTGRAEDDIDTLLKIKGNLIYPSFSRWLETDGEKEVSGITIKESQEDEGMHMIVHRNGNIEGEVLKAFGGNCDVLRIPMQLKSYVLYREWYSRLDTEPCIDILLYSTKKEEFGLVVVDLEQPMMIFPGFIWKAPRELIEAWLAKRAANAYRTTFEFQDIAAWLDHEITNSELQPSLILNYEDGLSICISGTNEIDEIRARPHLND